MNEQVHAEAPDDERRLRAWLDERGVTGYSQMLLVHERSGSPDFFTNTADELIDWLRAAYSANLTQEERRLDAAWTGRTDGHNTTPGRRRPGVGS